MQTLVASSGLDYGFNINRSGMSAYGHQKECMRPSGLGQEEIVVYMNTKGVIYFVPMTTSSCPISFAHMSHPVSINIVVWFNSSSFLTVLSVRLHLAKYFFS